jgi:hypothetical protein
VLAAIACGRHTRSLGKQRLKGEAESALAHSSYTALLPQNSGFRWRNPPLAAHSVAP